MRKRTAIAILIALIVLVLASCTSAGEPYTLTRPISASVSFPASGDYEILGRVKYVSEPGEASYAKLLETAKAIYPKTTDVVNITVDGAETYRDVTTKSIGGSSTYTEHIGSTYTMEGIAIHIFNAEV